MAACDLSKFSLEKGFGDWDSALTTFFKMFSNAFRSRSLIVGTRGAPDWVE
jgi:hypothetical protein